MESKTNEKAKCVDLDSSVDNIYELELHLWRIVSFYEVADQAQVFFL